MAIKESEKISGDNYAIFETEPGAYSMALSDGMGSGKKACRDSQMIVELMQKFMEAGFQREMAIQMINGVLLAGPEAGNMSTLDFCTIDLYTGFLELLKIGSAPTYIKREQLVERISAGNLPLGIFNRPDMEANRRRLQDGDYVIMISDGVLDALSQGVGEDMMSELIGGTDLKNPKEIANAMLSFCIRQCKGKVRDDMTVLVLGIWTNMT
jgi:stage II sporulation protein E